ncbi:MAG: tRNA (adenosine(37)-N6)-threonylcarbamoyltransferase complex transferase subunit TsaD [Desulfobulbus propionicus]|nr:MAG: tRNA (adenosine(37)-N6)-threonylcarbamoyltransferase complex transferase subunit TsaD [Desulfobulbus propionicus]
MRILALESSCDDTAAAVFDTEHYTVLANTVSSQNEIHARFGGIVPELASRRHIEMIWPMVTSALDQAQTTLSSIDLVAATQGPGLVGSLLVGFTFAKSLALVQNIPCVGVDHMAGHLLSCLLEEDKPDFPYTALVVSGGNTSLYSVAGPVTSTRMGKTRDDAAGEAFDKVAKMLDLGYPGGPVISRLAREGDPKAIHFPRSWLDKDAFDFSFSGLKTSVMNFIRKEQVKTISLPPKKIADICASFQEAVTEVLTKKTIMAAQYNKHKRIALGGGVAANVHLRNALEKECAHHGFSLFVPRPAYCTDNAAMIAIAGWYHYQHGHRTALDDDAYSRSLLA